MVPLNRENNALCNRRVLAPGRYADVSNASTRLVRLRLED